jgi:hypothetical protein
MVHMTDTPNLALPYILAAQAQKHVTHNEAIRALDCLVQLSVVSRSLTSPPETPDEGSRYIVASGATGDWATQDAKIAAYQDGAWAFYTPKKGWLAWVASENVLVVYEGSGWATLPSGGGGEGGVTDHGMLTGLADDDHLQYHTDARGDARYTPVDPATLGINATADTTNRLALKSPASLFDNEGNGHQVKVNKNAAADTASVLYQTNYSGRAEMGLAGDDDFHFKVSPDGSTWHDAILIDKDTGKVSCPKGGPTTQVFTSSGTWTKPTGCVKIKATIVGGGGGGGGALGVAGNCAVGSSGGGAETCVSFVDVTSVSSLTVTVGAAGSGGTAGQNNGSSGGTSGLGTANANGSAIGGGAGIGGGSSTTTGPGPGGGAGGTGGSGGTFYFAGQPGGFGVKSLGRTTSGSGGSSAVGGAGPSATASGAAANGNAALSYGGGGSAGVSCYVASDASGGDGFSGIVIIEEYYA